MRNDEYGNQNKCGCFSFESFVSLRVIREQLFLVSVHWCSFVVKTNFYPTSCLLV